ncbi:hypothetical protein LX32DRAFT_254287 [Colletotrichum zoysiae]|uniref:Uncharacterized protein n=1 Tax=Colletotrichum zoysiae TaxID=1216348 RepID=A0AAD9HTS7_9PEZI|nr:hypothetical protein LX32DRAFT_254287 [Colletotrichum zoysiae]
MGPMLLGPILARWHRVLPPALFPHPAWTNGRLQNSSRTACSWGPWNALFLGRADIICQVVCPPPRLSNEPPSLARDCWLPRAGHANVVMCRPFFSRHSSSPKAEERQEGQLMCPGGRCIIAQPASITQLPLAWWRSMLNVVVGYQVPGRSAARSRTKSPIYLACGLSTKKVLGRLRNSPRTSRRTSALLGEIE